jgi:two-component system, chemotaxis family, CheB/CheR fusion protein
MDAWLSRMEPRTALAEDVPVVIVEDDPDACEALKALVELDGYRVHTAASAEQAKLVIAEHAPLCVILDLGLPGESGIDLAHSLRSTQGNALVVIAVTGSVAPEDLLAAEEAGVDYLLHKPLDIERFRSILQPLH